MVKVCFSVISERYFPKYTIREEDRYWKPTPPDYMDGIEPHWQEIRTMVLDSSNQFPPKDPLPFDLKKGSPFQKQLMEVFEVTNGLTEEQVDIAKFWDCNPYVTHHRGHAMFAVLPLSFAVAFSFALVAFLAFAGARSARRRRVGHLNVDLRLLRLWGVLSDNLGSCCQE